MSESKHTPGPWTYSPPFDDGTILRSSWKPAIISRYEPASDDSKYRRLVYICAFEFRMTPSEADGRLMAAAPELLEAAINVAQWWDSDNKISPKASGVIDRLRAAIAKAKGEQP